MEESVNCKWKRPSSVPYPLIYRKFEGRKAIDGVVPKFWIQDIPEDQFDAAVAFMLSGFPYEEPMNKYSKLASDSESMNTLAIFLKEMLKDKLGLICYAENPDPKGKPIIVGVNVTHIKTKDDENVLEIKGDTLARIFETMEVVTNMADVFGTFNVNACLNAMGLYVSNEFRGQGLGLEILKAREDLCKAVGLSVIVTVFTATASQIIAQKAGYKTLSQILYSDLKRLHSKHAFPGIEDHTEALKYMYKII